LLQIDGVKIAEIDQDLADELLNAAKSSQSGLSRYELSEHFGSQIREIRRVIVDPKAP
jgi:hypothetical protein